MQIYLRLISALLLTSTSALLSNANDFYPESIDQRIKYETVIDMPKAYLSGILVLGRKSDTEVSGCIINEFGVSILGFTYDEKKEKIKLVNVMKALDHWYIKRELKKDIKSIMVLMQSGETSYYNRKRQIQYSFNLLNETEE